MLYTIEFINDATKPLIERMQKIRYATVDRAKKKPYAGNWNVDNDETGLSRVGEVKETRKLKTTRKIAVERAGLTHRETERRQEQNQKICMRSLSLRKP